MLALPAAALADTLVVRAIGPSATRYKLGQKLPANAQVTLKDGDTLVLLDERGSRTLHGPGSFNLAAPTAAAAPSRLAAIGGYEKGRPRVGAVRNPESAPRTKPNIWYVDAARGGATCLPQGTPVQLWRADSQAEGATTITAANGQSATVAWIKGEASHPWPDTLPVSNGAAYKLSGLGAGNAGTAIELRLLDAAPAGLDAMAQALIAKGCTGQLDLLIDTTETAG